MIFNRSRSWPHPVVSPLSDDVTPNGFDFRSQMFYRSTSDGFSGLKRRMTTGRSATMYTTAGRITFCMLNASVLTSAAH